ncbi:MAG: phosphotriesterase-related protein [Dehalococcoidia bacterium]|nr:phosphotriesterase-related protein [Dehalococcoidia bacterium]
MDKVNTVLGPIPVDQMGTTLMHEHMVFTYPGWELDALCRQFELAELADICAAALGEVKKYGVKTVVDATPLDLWRNVELDKAVADKTGLNIICATGMYTEAEGMPAYLKFRSQFMDTQNELYETLMQEITVGIGRSGARAGIIKVATGHGTISKYEEMVLKAAARAQKETGVPITTHTQQGTMGPEQADLLIGEGVKPEKIVIGHMCGNSSMEYQMAVLDKGVSVGFDRWGINAIYPDNLRKATLLGLLGLDLAGRIVLSHDCNAQWMGRPTILPDYLQNLMADWNYTHLFRNIIPQLKNARVTDEQIGRMLVENPRRIFSA